MLLALLSSSCINRYIHPWRAHDSSTSSCTMKPLALLFVVVLTAYRLLAAPQNCTRSASTLAPTSSEVPVRPQVETSDLNRSISGPVPGRPYSPSTNCTTYPKELQKRVDYAGCPMDQHDIIPHLQQSPPNQLLFFSKVDMDEYAFADANDFTLLVWLFVDAAYPGMYGCICNMFWEYAAQAASAMAVGDVHVLLPDDVRFPYNSDGSMSIWKDYEWPVLSANQKVCRIWRHTLHGGTPELVMSRSDSVYCGGAAKGIY